MSDVLGNIVALREKRLKELSVHTQPVCTVLLSATFRQEQH